MTTGKPPQPVVQIPTGDKDRLALGLPPLFKPITEYDPILAGRPKEANNSLVTVLRKTNPGDIPATQDFKGEKVGGETFYTICCSEPYTWFSPEVRLLSHTHIWRNSLILSYKELRYYAYQKGHKCPPSDEMQSITAKPEFSQHSFEVCFVFDQDAVHHLLDDRAAVDRLK
jgi:hypothetical protein